MLSNFLLAPVGFYIQRVLIFLIALLRWTSKPAHVARTFPPCSPVIPVRWPVRPFREGILMPVRGIPCLESPPLLDLRWIASSPAVLLSRSRRVCVSQSSAHLRTRKGRPRPPRFGRYSPRSAEPFSTGRRSITPAPSRRRPRRRVASTSVTDGPPAPPNGGG